MEFVDVWLWIVVSRWGLFVVGIDNFGFVVVLCFYLIVGIFNFLCICDFVEGIMVYCLWLGFMFDCFEVSLNGSIILIGLK